MSRENERSRAATRFYESLVAGEPNMTLVTEDFEYQQHFGSTEGRYVGEAGLRRWIGTFYEIWDQASISTESVRGATDRIALVTRGTVRGRMSGIEVETAQLGFGGSPPTDAFVGSTCTTMTRPQKRPSWPGR